MSAGSNIAKEQYRYLQSVMRELKKLPRAEWFAKPVDAMALNIPDYYRIITDPMDLGTVGERVDKKMYMDVREFEHDMQLIFSNCYKYNGPNHAVSKVAKAIEDEYLMRMKNFPAAGFGSAGEDTPVSPKLGASRASLPGVPPPRAKAVAAKDPRRHENEMNFVRKIITEFKRKKYHPDNSWFLYPVGDLPGYRDVVEYPMDISTMEKKLSSKLYASADDFAEDVKLMFRNCYAFNRMGDEVYNAGKRLEAVFDAEWARKPDFSIARPPSKKKKGSSSDESEESSESDSDGSDSSDEERQSRIKLLQTQLDMLMTQMTALVNKKGEKKKHKKDKKDKERRKKEKRERKERERLERDRQEREWDRDRYSVPPKTKSSKVEKKSKKPSVPGMPKKSEGKREITLEDKQFLTEQINNLNPEYLTEVVTIIQQNMPHLAVGYFRVCHFVSATNDFSAQTEHGIRRNRAGYRYFGSKHTAQTL